MEVKECKVCCSEIPVKAKKCRYCHEWQKEKPDIVKPNRPELGNVKLIIPFQHRMLSNSKSFFIYVLLITTLIYAGIQIAWYRLDEEKVYLISFALFAAQMVISWAGLIWISNVVKKYYSVFMEVAGKTNAKDLFIKYQKRMFSFWPCLSAGLLTGLIASMGDWYVGAPFKTIEAKYIFAGFEFINMFFAGAAILSILIFADFVRKLTSNVSEQTIMSLEQKRSVNKFGAFHLKTSMMAVVPLFLGVLAKLVGDWKWDILVITWYVILAIAVIIYIYWPMVNIHELMKNDLENQINQIQEKMRKKIREIELNPSSSNFSKLNQLRSLENNVAGTNTWPFDPKSIWAVFLSIFFPIILMVIDRLFNI